MSWGIPEILGNWVLAIFVFVIKLRNYDPSRKCCIIGKWHAGNSGSGVRKSPLSVSLGYHTGAEVGLAEGARPQSLISLQVCPCIYDNGTIWHSSVYGITSVKTACHNVVKSNDCSPEFVFYSILIPDSKLLWMNQKSRKDGEGSNQ